MTNLEVLTDKANRDSLKINHAILNEMQQMLRLLGRPFAKETLLTPYGSFTKALYREDINPFLLDEEVAYMNEVLPKGTYACKVRGALYIHILEFKSFQLRHYAERLQQAKTAEEAAFLRQSLHGLKKSNTDDNNIPSFNASPSFNTTQFQQTQKSIL